MNIAKYYASIGFQVDTREIQKVDRALKLIEGKLKGLQKRLATTLTFDISKFDVNQKRLNRVLGDALDIASTRTVFQVSRFNIDQGSLNRSLTRAMTEASRVASIAAPMRPNTHASVARAAATGAAFGGIGLGRLGAAGLALAGGGYGLSALNKRNQEVVAAQLQAQAVISGNAESLGLNPEQATQQGKDQFEFLRRTANRVGFNYLEASNDFNTLTSNLLGSGGTVKQAQNIFKGFAEYGRVNKLSAERQKLVFNALSQIAGKDKLQAEELTKQLGNSLPGAKDIFAQAYQKQTGGGLTGSAAIIALEAAMKKGLVRGDILDVAANIASQRSQAGLANASQASQAEQARYQNAVSDLAVVASNAGVEEGFARIFRTLNAGLSESNDLVEMLARGFNDATKWADDLLLFPQSFARALEGKDSIVADWLGEDATKQLQEDWKSIKDSMESISSIGAPSWLPTLESTSRDIAEQFRIIAALASGDFSGLGDALKNFVSDRYTTYGNAIASGPNFALRAVGNFFDTSVPQINFGSGSDSFAPKSVMDLYGLGNNPSNGDQSRFDLFSKQQVGPKESNAFGMDPANIGFNLPTNEFDKSFTGADAKQVTTNNEITIQLNIDPITLAQMDIQAQAQELTQAFAMNLEQVLVQFPNKE